jgi:hypothetical protein
MEIKNTNFEKWLQHATSEIVKLCGMGALTVRFYSSKSDSKGITNESNMVVFSIKYDKSYKTAYIHYYPVTLKLFNNNRIADLIDALSHEISHIFSYPIFEIAQRRYTTKREIIEANEEMTESISILVRQLIGSYRPELLKEKRGVFKRPIRCPSIQKVRKRLPSKK